MAFDFRPAVRENVGLLIGLSGSSGSGKTYTAMRLAKGISGAKRFAVIDSEAGRAKHYADQFAFDHGDLKPPFRPSTYADAIKAADKAGYTAIVVDSASHEWAGDGGILDWQEEELQRMAGEDFKRRDACKMASWIKPKMAHKKMVQQLLQVRAHLILCFRAEPKIEMVKGQGGAWEVQAKQSLVGLNGWIPIAEKNLPFEMTASFLLMADRPGVPLPIKLQEQHKAFFPVGEAITEASGERLAAWARGATAASQPRVDWLTKIAAASTKAELSKVGQALKKESIAKPLIDTLREAYDARLKVLAGGKPPTAPNPRAQEMNWGKP